MNNTSCGGCEATCVTSCIGVCARDCKSSATTNVNVSRMHNISIPSTTQITIGGSSIKIKNIDKR